MYNTNYIFYSFNRYCLFCVANLDLQKSYIVSLSICLIYFKKKYIITKGCIIDILQKSFASQNNSILVSLDYKSLSHDVD